MGAVHRWIERFVSRGSADLEPHLATYLRRWNAFVGVFMAAECLIVLGLVWRQPWTAAVNVVMTIGMQVGRVWLFAAGTITEARTRRVADTITVWIIGCVCVTALLNSGIEASGLWYLILVPQIRVHLDGAPAGRRWTAITAAAVVVTALVDPYWPFVRELEREPATLVTSFRIGLLLWVLASATASRRATEWHLSELQTRESLLERQAQELARARDAANAACAQAEEANRAKSRFLANMSHEIRTPMNGVLGMADLLLATPLDAHQRDFAGTIRSSGQSLLAIINDILDFSKIEAGKMTLETADFELRRTVEETVVVFGDLAQTKGLELCIWVAPELPRVLVGDPTRLRQVLGNLLSNAVKFTEAGEIAVRVERGEALPRTASDGSELCPVRFSVSDTGMGIDPETQAMLFQPFTQADASTTRRFGGTGLGLSISRQLISLMRGTIELSSAPRRGTSIRFEVPLARSSCAAQPPLTELAPVRRALARRRVLVVEDSASAREFLRRALEAAGMIVSEAASAEEARAELERATSAELGPDLLLVDTTLPDDDGRKLAVELVRSGELAAERIIALAPLAQIAATGAPQAATRTLAKPVRLAPLLETVALALTGQPLALPTAEMESELALDRAALSRLRVLVVEDSPMNQRVVVAFLRKFGVEPQLASDGASALAVLEHAPPFDLIFMDCQMPVMDGYQATAELRRREAGAGRRTPVIALTANTMASDRERCREAGMDDHLSKPISLRALTETLQTWLARIAASQASRAEPDRS